VAHSTALHSVIRGRGSYLVGPLARFNLNFDRLSESCRRLATEIGLTPPCRNPFKSLLARGIEILYACEEAIRIIESYEPPTEPSVPLPARAGTGCAMTEAPRGLIFHRYRIAANGQIEDAKIVPPTSQNQRSIEEDLRKYVETNVNLPKKELTWGCEQTVRNYDPCISCAAHFLEVKFEEQL
jgi:coenzyme F420-reducing hydrogenase alpha subunit